MDPPPAGESSCLSVRVNFDRSCTRPFQRSQPLLLLGVQFLLVRNRVRSFRSYDGPFAGMNLSYGAVKSEAKIAGQVVVVYPEGQKGQRFHNP
jgi:hypothetical protein